MSNFHKMFNSETITGRANVAKATYGSFALLYIIHRLRKRSKAQCPDCACKTCDSGNEAAAADGHVKSETTCDPEVWKQAIHGDNAGGEKEAPGAKHDSHKVQKGADIRAINMSNSGKK